MGGYFCHVDALIFIALDDIIIITINMHTILRRTHMKIAKRVLLCILALALLVSGLVIASFADDAEIPEGGEPVAPVLPDYADVLKYYDPVYSTLFANDNFSGDYAGAVEIMDSAAYETAYGVTAGSDAYLYIRLGHILNPDARTNAVYRVGFGAISKLVARATVSGSHDNISGMVCDTCSFTTDNVSLALCPNCSLELRLVKSKEPVVSFSVSADAGIGASLVKLDFATGRILYYNGSGYDVYEGYSICADKEYTVEVVCDGTGYSFSVTGPVSKDDATVVTHTSGVISAPIDTFTSFNVGADYADDVRNATIKIDDVFVQAGLDNRTVGVNLAKATADGLQVIADVINSVKYSAEIKLDAIGVYDKLLSTYAAKYNATKAASGVLQDQEDTLNDVVSKFFVNGLGLISGTIDTTADYSVRLAHIDDNKVYSERVALLLAGVEDIETASPLLQAADTYLGMYNIEKKNLETLASESERFIAYIAEESLNNPETFSTEDYDIINNFLTEVRAEFEKDGVKTYSVTYPAIKEANGTYTVLESKFNTYLAKSETFCKSVEIAAKASGAAGDELSDEEYSKSLEAYEIAKNIGFSNSTFPGMAEALVVFANLKDLDEKSIVAKRFIDNVATAEQAIYLFMKEEMLDTAAEDLDEVDNRYPGVSAAISTYNVLRQQISDQKAAADAYIAAVNAIDGKTGDELIAAIDAALALRDAGNVTGYEGITEANIALNHAYSSEQLKVAYANKFVRLVAAIKDAKTLEERYVAISAADQARGFALDSYEGVKEASEELVIAMSRYNADIAAINDSYTEVAENSGILSVASTVLSKIMKLVVSAIKAIAE